MTERVVVCPKSPPVQALHEIISHQGAMEVQDNGLTQSNDVEDKEKNENLQVENLVFNEAGVSPETVITHKGKNKGECDDEERTQLWNDIYCISNDIQNSPWLIGGDFNVIMSDEEKIGGLPVYLNEYEDFAFCVNSCDLVEVSFKGSPFTWWNRRIDDQCIFKRLDRYMMNQVGLGYFGLVESEHLARTRSDHAPMLLNCGQKTDIKAQAELKKYVHFEEEYWRQKAGIQWFTEGEKNTRFFHSIVGARRRKLSINRIQNKDGEWVEGEELVSAAA
ncbi:hypothetical protein H5410_012411 [Solanum commersonii]|uniref:Uncharacterized protein n=1 Tax=Solanum commersonii TaxID=4109 RepID=A0A9J6ASA9_SOLCO|nr:hypothetical protein H5410_012411 [Solanum commersonii]